MNEPPYLLEETTTVATIAAIVVRNALEHLHVQHIISDTQMRQLNPVVRNAIATALHGLHHYDTVDAAKGYIDYHAAHIPPYWEAPKLLPAYVAVWKGERRRERDTNGPDQGVSE